MKIVFMLLDAPNYFGGPTTNARRLLPELKKRGHEIHAMILFKGEEIPTTQYLKSQGIHCYLYPRQSYTQAQLTWILKQLQYINPDIFVPNIFVSGYYAAKWTQEAGIPAIAAHRSNDEFHWQMVNEFVVGDPQWAVAGLVCVNDQLKAEVKKLNPQKTQLCVIPSGVPIPEASSAQKTPLKIAYVGRLVQEQKRVRETLEALIEVTKRYQDISVTFFGEGGESSYLEKRVAQVNLSEKISFAGSVPSEELHKQLIEHNILVLLSDYEGTPGAIMDGMACGLVPVCTNISGGVQELVIPNQTGLLVRDRAESFQQAIDILYNNPEWRVQLANNARQHIINEYSLEEAVNRWENFCQELIATAPFRSQIRIPRFYHLPLPQNCRDYRQPSIWKTLSKKNRKMIVKSKVKIANLAKELVKSSLKTFGYKIIKISQTEKENNFGKFNSKPYINSTRIPELITIQSKLEQFCQSGINSDPEKFRHYINNQRLFQYYETVLFCEENGIIFNDKIVADAGYGPGVLLKLVELRHQPLKLVGYDPSTGMTVLADYLLPEAQLERKDILSIQSENHDIIFLTQVLEHMVNPVVILHHLIKRVSSNGSLIITVPDGRQDQSTPGKFLGETQKSYTGHINFWSPESWKIFLNKELPCSKITTGILSSGNNIAIIQTNNYY